MNITFNTERMSTNAHTELGIWGTPLPNSYYTPKANVVSFSPDARGHVAPEGQRRDYQPLHLPSWCDNCFNASC